MLVRDGLRALNNPCREAAPVTQEVGRITGCCRLPEYGSFVVMDLAYRRLGLDLRIAMTVLTTVISANHQGFVTVDGGFKAFSTDRGYGPEAPDLSGSSYRFGGDEFGYLEVNDTGRLPSNGIIWSLSRHCDRTVNLYDRIHVRRDDQIFEVWPVMERMRCAP